MNFVGIFAQRQEELKLALSIHAAVGADAVNQKLNIVRQQNEEILQRYVVPLQIRKAKF